MKKIIASLIILVLPALAAAENYNSISAMLHHTPSKYNNSRKEGAVARGLYFYWGHGLNHSFEGAFDHTWLKYADKEELRQNDFTFIYTNYHYYPYKFMLGAHRINSNPGENILTLFGGINNYIIGERELQLNLFYTRHKEDDPYLSVFQITPEYGAVLLKGSMSSLYAKIKGNYIHLSDNKLSLDKKDLYSMELTLTYYYKKLRVTAFGWDGEQAFAVREGGFAVYNLPEKHTGGYGVKIGLPVYRTTYVYLSCAKENFSDISDDDEDSDAVVAGFSIAHTF